MYFHYPKNFLPGDEVIFDASQSFLFEVVWHWILHIPRHWEGTVHGIVRARSTTIALIAVREMKPFEVGRGRSMFREDKALSNQVSGTKTNRRHDVTDFPACIAIVPGSVPFLKHALPETASYVRSRKLSKCIEFPMLRCATTAKRRTQIRNCILV
ncbi:hypothetical protein AVEN_154207-1 [Araneus ventricosus]|uniref:Uncharacterized protein n=1 Tax=Araneus ventricosus TaxID=182803 RepID=A0A4Y2RLQ7_ARAVE|nr:hypothetical protein AVEN_154207-1 [Araneus ventricosus]